MDANTEKVIAWDMSHLTLQQIDHLHAIKAQAVHEWAVHELRKARALREKVPASSRT